MKRKPVLILVWVKSKKFSFASGYQCLRKLLCDTSRDGKTTYSGNSKLLLSTVCLEFRDGLPKSSLDFDGCLGDFVNHLWADGYPFQWAWDCI